MYSGLYLENVRQLVASSKITFPTLRVDFSELLDVLLILGNIKKLVNKQEDRHIISKLLHRMIQIRVTKNLQNEHMQSPAASHSIL